MHLLARLYRRTQLQIQAHRPFLVILLLFLAFRLMAVLVFRPGGYLGDISTFGYYRLLIGFTGQGYYPFVDYWVEYPPLFPWIMVGLYRLSLLVPAWSEPGTWFFLFLSAFLVVCEAANLVLFYGIAHRLYSQDRALHLSWIYALLLVPVLTLFMAFDSLVLLFLLWALVLILDRRPVGAGIAVGLGFMAKLIPVVAVPAAWRYLGRWSKRIKLAVAAAVAALLVAAPFLLTRPDLLAASFLSSMRRASWETLWALLDGYYSFGVAGGLDRFDPSQAGAAQHASQLPWTLITAGFGLFYLALLTRPAAWQKRRPVVAFTALTLNLLTLYFKGYSPQFLVMLLPFVILLLPGWRGVVYALLLSAINLAEFPIYFVLLPDQHWLLTGTVLLRTLILVVVGVEYAAQAYEWQTPDRWWRRTAWGMVAADGGHGTGGRRCRHKGLCELSLPGQPSPAGNGSRADAGSGSGYVGSR